jgi:hypothetical protein
MEGDMALTQAKNIGSYLGNMGHSNFFLQSIPNDIIFDRAVKLGVSLGSSPSKMI